MSTKYCGLVVTFESEISEEYLEILKNMIMSFKGVIPVEEKESDWGHQIAYSQAAIELRDKLFDVFIKAEQK